MDIAFPLLPRITSSKTNCLHKPNAGANPSHKTCRAEEWRRDLGVPTEDLAERDRKHMCMDQRGRRAAVRGQTLAPVRSERRSEEELADGGARTPNPSPGEVGAEVEGGAHLWRPS
jgi:hypothetical protein